MTTTEHPTAVVTVQGENNDGCGGCMYQCITFTASLYDSLLMSLKLAVTVSDREEVHQSVWISNQQSHLIVL